MLSQKNASLSPAVMSLGLGDQLQQQTEDEEAQRKKKLAMAKMNPLGPATMSLFSMAGSGSGA